MDRFFQIVIYGFLGLLLTVFMVGCVTGCAMFGDNRVCPEGMLKKVEYETDRNGDRVIRSITCYPKEGHRP
jgi:hypothetical protein